MTNLFSKITIIATVAAMVAMMLPLPAGAQKNDTEAFIKKRTQEIDSLKKVAEKFYNDNVKPYEEKTQNLENKTSFDKNKQNELTRLNQEKQTLENQIQASQKEINNIDNDIKSSQDSANVQSALKKYVIKLLNTQYDKDQAKKLKKILPKINDPKVRKNAELLLEYGNIAAQLRKPLEDLQEQLEITEYAKQDKDSPIITSFLNDWNNVEYIKAQKLVEHNSDRKSIPYLDKVIANVNAMAKNYFSDSTKLQNVIDELKSKSVNVQSPDEKLEQLNKNLKDEKNKQKQLQESLKKTEEQINAINSEFEEVNSNISGYNAAEATRHEMTEKWYDILEDCDKLILDAARYCLSIPCDTVGVFKSAAQLTIPLLKEAYHKSYRARAEKYTILINDYENHVIDIGKFWQKNWNYTKSKEGLIKKDKDEIRTGLENLDYYKNYYKKRNEKNAVSSPNLDSFLQEFESMFNKEFKGCREQYKKLGERLRGVTAKPKAAKPQTTATQADDNTVKQEMITNEIQER